jgi:hypothetical protein
MGRSSFAGQSGQLFNAFNWPSANAIYFLAFNEPEKVLAELEREAKVASLMSLMNLRDPSLSALKGNLRYERLVAQLTSSIDQQR